MRNGRPHLKIGLNDIETRRSVYVYPTDSLANGQVAVGLASPASPPSHAHNAEMSQFNLGTGVQHRKAANPVIMHARARYSTRIFGTGIRVKLVYKKQ